MAIQYRDRRTQLLRFLKTRNQPEAKVLAAFIQHAMNEGKAGQITLTVSLEQFRDLSSYAMSFINQE